MSPSISSYGRERSHENLPTPIVTGSCWGGTFSLVVSPLVRCPYLYKQSPARALVCNPSQTHLVIKKKDMKVEGIQNRKGIESAQWEWEGKRWEGVANVIKAYYTHV